MMRRFVLVAAALFCATCGQLYAGSNWSVVNACWRPDENPWAKQQVWDGWIWAEGWGH